MEPVTAHDGSAEHRQQVMRWRKLERARLLAVRMSVGADLRLQWSKSLVALVADSADLADRTVSFYWPFRGEPDLRPLAAIVLARGGRCALPVVVEKGKPLEFWSWQPGDALAPGVWNIPIPIIRDTVIPDIVLSPVVGFDADRYRLGYGGGFFDRTLAAMAASPLVIGVGYDLARMDTIHPLPHDIAMSLIVTESGVRPIPAGRQNG
ncbi:5,10-methenyltetrahydrofolate synthetase [Hoeflea marina]|uniref:5-formyltetrahydrofolate cyclo-ligase n=1 Tax=Hoeflea marina TaxID=274592 RepID=A0A317PEP9_9HYPH|nr:5-formyltetrahydrofolate cyclo-ligase [Hoeflea marina]PWV97204.1 5,10-methenyltetrahydrofolate synthetase [Hoeflea marina]